MASGEKALSNPLYRVPNSSAVHGSPSFLPSLIQHPHFPPPSPFSSVLSTFPHQSLFFSLFLLLKLNKIPSFIFPLILLSFPLSNKEYSHTLLPSYSFQFLAFVLILLRHYLTSFPSLQSSCIDIVIFCIFCSNFLFYLHFFISQYITMKSLFLVFLFSCHVFYTSLFFFSSKIPPPFLH